MRVIPCLILVSVVLARVAVADYVTRERVLLYDETTSFPASTYDLESRILYLLNFPKYTETVKDVAMKVDELIPGYMDYAKLNAQLLILYGPAKLVCNITERICDPIDFGRPPRTWSNAAVLHRIKGLPTLHTEICADLSPNNTLSDILAVQVPKQALKFRTFLASVRNLRVDVRLLNRSREFCHVANVNGNGNAVARFCGGRRASDDYVKRFFIRILTSLGKSTLRSRIRLTKTRRYFNTVC